MSKQLKYKFKKVLKKADFINADLEYHEELLPEANLLFQETLQKIIERLTPEEKARIQSESDRKAEKVAQEAAKRASQKQEEEDTSAEEEGDEEEVDSLEGGGPPSKASQLKKLFYRVAERSHPDKAASRGTTDIENERLEKIFKRAREAYDSHNWYILYSIALDLGIPISNPSPEHIEWMEEDIRRALSDIAQIANLVAWNWYIGTEEDRLALLRTYFLNIYGIDLGDPDH
jgi:DNA primase